MKLRQKKRKIGIKEWGKISCSCNSQSRTIHLAPNCSIFQFSAGYSHNIWRPTGHWQMEQKHSDFPVYSSTVEVGAYKSCLREAIMGVSDIARSKMYKYKIQEMKVSIWENGRVEISYALYRSFLQERKVDPVPKNHQQKEEWHGKLRER